MASVGAILFECLTGRPPHVGETSDAVLHLIRTRRAPRVRDVSSRVAREVADVVDKAHACKMPAVAVTDHGNMYGAIEFYKTAQEKGLKPIG